MASPGDPARSVKAWAVDDPEPTNLLALWPQPSPPEVDGVRSALEGRAPVRRVDAVDAGPDVLWMAVLEPRASGSSLLLWAEPARPLTPGELDDPAAAACRWALGVQRDLDHEDPLSSYVEALRVLLAAVPDTPAVLDVNAGTWHRRPSLDAHFRHESIDPPAEVMWVIHAVESAPHRTVWLHTHGLNRCGRPDLEMLEVPAPHAADAASLLNDLATWFLEHEPPAPGEAFEVGPGLRVTLQPLSSVARYLEDDCPGSIPDRERSDPAAHAGVRAVLCAPHPRGTFRRIWTWPEQVVTRLARGEAMVYRTERASAREASLARATWTHFTRAVRNARSCEAFVKAAYEDSRGGEGREHLWFAVRAATEDAVRAELLNDPVIAGLRRGEVYRVDHDRITDWRIGLDGQRYEPVGAARLAAALDERSPDPLEPIP